MAKSTKHQDKVGSFENFRAPWETESGAEVDVDKATLKRLLFNLKVGEARALDGQDDAKANIALAETERDEAKEQAANANPAEAQKQIDKLTKQVTDLTAERDGLAKDKEITDLRAEVLAGVDPKHAKHVTGETREELEKSLKEIREDFGLPTPGEGGDDDGDEDDERVYNRPRTDLKNPVDAQSGRGPDGNYDFDKVADDIVGNSIFG